ncbi:MAG TPA: DciA family protein [Rhodanobacteraceae bacterium]
MESLAKLARKREQMDLKLRTALPALLQDPIRLADFRNGRLVFLAPSSAWAARLRLAQPQIVAAARALGVDAVDVGIKVSPPVATRVTPPPPYTPLSPATANHLTATARTLSDPELRDLFLKLASCTEDSDSPRKAD